MRSSRTENGGGCICLPSSLMAAVTVLMKSFSSSAASELLNMKAPGTPFVNSSTHRRQVKG